MPRKTFSIQQVYIADGFADDCDELIHRCSRVDVLNYRTFCIYYKEMNFASAYQGRTSNAEVAEVSEELLQIAKYYMVLDTSNFEESIAGLFLVYALLNLQPYPRFAALRIVPDDIPAIERIERVARRERRHDVLYVLGSVLIRGPVQYQAVNRPRGMETAIKKNLDGFCNIDITGVRPKGVYYRQNEELDIIRDMSGIFKRYSQAKSHIPGWRGRALSHSNDKLAEDLGTSLKRVISGIVEESGDKGREDMVQEIKKRAMKNVVGVVRHLDSASQRSPEKKIKQEVKPTTPTTPKSSITQSPKRRPHTPPKTKKSKKKYNSSSSEESEEELEDFCIETQGSLKAIEDPTDDESSRIVKKQETGGRVLEEQEINFEIDSLPPLVTAEMDGRLVEIEFIDEMKKLPLIEERNKVKNNDLTKSATDRNIMFKGNEMEKGDETNKGTETKKKKAKKGNEIKTRDDAQNCSKMSERNRMSKGNKTQEDKITKNDDSMEVDEIDKNENDTEDKQEDIPRKRRRSKKEESHKNDDEMFKKPILRLRSSPRLQKISKRDMKKPILKSKFKKMGILSVANFEEETSKD